MWLDNASDVDILFYEPYAEVISDIALTSEYKPLTIGVFGVWGSGKSTLLNLIEKKIADTNNTKNICVNINAWSFEGYEDAKIAVMETLLRELREKAPEGLRKKIIRLLKKVDILKLMTKAVGVTAPVVASVATGSPLPIVLGLNSADNIGQDVKTVSEAVQSIRDDYMKDDESLTDSSIVNNIRQFRTEFQDALRTEDIDNVIVLIDDLDRCQPERIIETLEAIKLFLSVEKTVFVIAADVNVIQYAINRKYPPLNNYKVDLDNEYIEKIIQLPIYIPELSDKDIQNYLMLLVVQHYTSEEQFIEFISKVKSEEIMISENLIDLQKMKELTSGYINDNKEFESTIGVISGIKDIIAGNLKGNPRQAKRFLNTFITKKKLAELYYGTGDDALNPTILAKLLVLQKLDESLFVQLSDWNRKFTTTNEDYKKMKDSIDKESVDDKYKRWQRPMIKRWVLSEPVALENERLDRYFYLTRENLKKSKIDESTLTHAAKNVLQRLGTVTRGNVKSIIEDLKVLSPSEQDDVFNVLFPKIEEGEIEMFVCRDLFTVFEEYRTQIVDTLSKRQGKIALGEVAAIKEMRKKEPEIIDGLLNDWGKLGIINQKYTDKIKD